MKKTDSLYYKLFNSQAKNYSLQWVKKGQINWPFLC
jgi:hypothetical protein